MSMENENNDRILITVEEARKLLGIGRNLMLELVKVKGFPVIKFKRKILINKAKLQEWINENYGEYGEY